MPTFPTKHLTSSKTELTAAASVQRYGLSPKKNDKNTKRLFGYATVYKSALVRLVMQTCHATCHTREQLSVKMSRYLSHKGTVVLQDFNTYIHRKSTDKPVG